MISFMFDLFILKYWFLCEIYIFLIIESAVCQRYEYVQNDAAVPVNSAVTSLSDHAVKVNYTCPRSSDPKHHTECCSMVDSKGCCPRTRYFYEIDRT